MGTNAEGDDDLLVGIELRAGTINQSKQEGYATDRWGIKFCRCNSGVKFKGV